MKKLFACLAAVGILATVPFAADAGKLTVACTPVPHGDILRHITPDLKARGVDLKILEFSDYVSPNVALDAGEVDANYFQHGPFLNNAVKNRGLKIVGVAPIHILPMAAYSDKLQDIRKVRKGGKVAIPNDPSNGGRALLLLQSAGLIKLKPDAGVTASPLDIASNPKRLRFVEVEAAQVPRTIPDVDIAVANSNYAIAVGLNPVKDSKFLESSDSPYAVLVATRKGNENNPDVKALVDVLRSQKVKDYMKRYEGSVIPVF